MEEFSSVFQPIKIGSLELKNRLIMAPMVTNYCENDGTVTERLKSYLGSRAKGGIGMIIVEGAYVHQTGKGFSCELGIYKDELIDGLKALTHEVHQYGAKICQQLLHSGRQAYSAVTGAPLMAPSPIPCPVVGEIPVEMTQENIAVMVDAFGQAARRAKAAGFDAVEIHGAHGYLINQFVSGYSNKRSDEYGGTLANRAKFPLEILKSIRKEVGDDFPVTYRMSSAEHVADGLTIEDTTEFAKMLVQNGIDAIHVSGGVYETAAMIIQPAAIPQGVYVDNAAAIKEAVKGKVPVIAVGRIKDPVMAEEIIASGKADMVAMGRALLADAELPAKLMAGEYQELRKCIGCNQGCIDRLFLDVDINCQVNPLTGREYQYDLNEKAEEKKKVLVIGGGPGGLEAARIAALRGHEVFLYEKDEKLGGQLNVAAVPPHKEEIKELVDFLVFQMQKMGVKVKIGEEVNEKVLDDIKPEVVIMATGSTPIIPNMPGMEDKQSYTAREVLAGVPGAFIDNAVVIGGGSTGCETAEYLAEGGAKVSVVEMQNDVVYDVGALRKFLLTQRMAEKGIRIFTQSEAKSVKSGNLIVEKDGNEETISGFDTVIWAVGNQPEINMQKPIENRGLSFYKIGDCVEPRKITDAIHEGFLRAFEI